jgi:hypothetical protein
MHIPYDDLIGREPSVLISALPHPWLVWAHVSGAYSLLIDLTLSVEIIHIEALFIKFVDLDLA